jgi:hypothetical protein
MTKNSAQIPLAPNTPDPPTTYAERAEVEAEHSATGGRFRAQQAIGSGVRPPRPPSGPWSAEPGPVPGPELPIDCTDCGDVLGEALGGASEATEPEESEI